MKKYLKKGLFVLLFMMISIIWQAEEGKAEDLLSGDFKYVVNEDTEEETITIVRRRPTARKISSCASF